MKRRILLGSFVCAILVVASLGVACSTTQTVTNTQTITTTQIQTRTQNQTTTVPTTIITTITQTVAGEAQTSVVTLTGVPPLIPHPIDVVQGSYGTCFQCHPIPPGHTGRIANEDLCTQCHQLGPVDPNLVAP
jgi:nitrate reductase cytochrome c-type subunit